MGRSARTALSTLQPTAFERYAPFPVERMDVIEKGDWRAVISRRADGLLEVFLEHWEDIGGEECPAESFWWSRASSGSMTDTIEIARKLAAELLQNPNH
jgi:hypothetical protein